MDLLAVVVVSLILVPLTIFWGGNPVSLVLGLIFALFLPGYALMAAVFPKRHDLDTVRRLALSFGFSIVVVPLVGVFLNYTPWGIGIYSVLISLLVFIIIAAAAAWFRRRRIIPEERFEPRFHFSLAGFRGRKHLWDVVLLVLLVVVIIGAIGTLVYVARPAEEPGFTEFYMLGPEGRAENYTDVVVLGEEAAITLGVINHERVASEYSMRVFIEGKTVAEVATGTLEHGEGWEQKVSFTPLEVGEAQLVEIWLYREDKNIAYYVLRLWIDVVGNK